MRTQSPTGESEIWVWASIASAMSVQGASVVRRVVTAVGREERRAIDVGFVACDEPATRRGAVAGATIRVCASVRAVATTDLSFVRQIGANRSASEI